MIDFDGMALITEHLTNIVETFSQDENLKASGKFSITHKSHERVEFGISLDYGNNIFGAGFSPQVNFGNFAIRPELHYEYSWLKHETGMFTTNSLTLPLNLVLQTHEMWLLGWDIFFGGYYSYHFNGNQEGKILDFENTFNRNEFGLNFGFSITLKPIREEFGFRFPLTDFTKSAGTYNGHIRSPNLFYISLIFTLF